MYADGYIYLYEDTYIYLSPKNVKFLLEKSCIFTGLFAGIFCQVPLTKRPELDARL